MKGGGLFSAPNKRPNIPFAAGEPGAPIRAVVDPRRAQVTTASAARLD